MLYVVLIGLYVAEARQKSEAFRIGVDEGRDLQRVAIGDRAPEPFVLAGEHLQPIGSRRRSAADFVGAAMVERREQRGRRRAAEPQMIDRHAREQSELGVDDRRLAGPQREQIGSRHALRIEQRVNDQRVVGDRRLLDPEAAEDGELLAARIGGADGEAAGGDALESGHGTSAR